MPINRWTESDTFDPMFEKPQKAQVARIKIEAISLDSTSIAPFLDGPLLGRSPKFTTVRLSNARLAAAPRVLKR